MLKALTVCGLAALSFAMRVEMGEGHLNKDHPTTTSALHPVKAGEAQAEFKLSDAQKKWDEYYRGQIKAIGDAKPKEAAEKDGITTVKYFDDKTQTAWEVQGKGEGDDRRVEKAVQTKVEQKDGKTIATTTTFLRKNVADISKDVFQ